MTLCVASAHNFQPQPLTTPPTRLLHIKSSRGLPSPKAAGGYWVLNGQGYVGVARKEKQEEADQKSVGREDMKINDDEG